MNKILLLLTTESNKKFAENIAKELIENKLAACVSIKEIDSIYSWDGKICQQNEFEISIKSIPDNRNELIKILKKRISYELPQFIYKEFDSEVDYFNWINESVSRYFG